MITRTREPSKPPTSEIAERFELGNRPHLRAEKLPQGNLFVHVERQTYRLCRAQYPKGRVEGELGKSEAPFFSSRSSVGRAEKDYSKVSLDLSRGGRSVRA